VHRVGHRLDESARTGGAGAGELRDDPVGRRGLAERRPCGGPRALLRVRPEELPAPPAEALAPEQSRVLRERIEASVSVYDGSQAG